MTKKFIEKVITNDVLDDDVDTYVDSVASWKIDDGALLVSDVVGSLTELQLEVLETWLGK